MNTLKDYVNFRLTHADKVAEAEGYPLKMENCKKYKKMKQLELYGNSLQDGTPTPDAPVEVVSVGDKSVNLFDKDNITVYSVSATAKFDVTETGIRCYCTSNQKLIHLHFDLGLASEFEGKKICATMNCPIVNNEHYKTTGFTIRDTNVNTQIGYPSVTNDELYMSCTVGTGYTTEHLILRLYVNGGNDYLKDTYYFNNIMVYEGTDKRAYEPYGKYKIPVVQRGKNLWDKENYLVSSDQDTSLRREFLATEYDWLKPGNTITLSLTIFVSENDTRVNPKFTCCVLGTDGKEYGSKHLSSYSKGVEERKFATYTIPQIAVDIKALYVRPIDYGSNSGGVWDAYAKDIQIELGDTATPYEPYVEPVTTNIFLDEPLRKLGDYADYIDFKENKVVRNVKKHIFTGNEFLANIDSISGSFAIVVSTINLPDNGVYAYCNKLKGKSWGTIILNNTKEPADYTLGIARSNGSLRFTYSNEISHISSNRDICKAQLKTWYNEGNPMYAIYLNTPTEEPLNIYFPKLTAKTTIVEIDTSLTPSNTYGKYIKR